MRPRASGHAGTHLVCVSDEEHAVVCGRYLERMRLIQQVLCALDRQAPPHLHAQGFRVSSCPHHTCRGRAAEAFMMLVLAAVGPSMLAVNVEVSL